MVGMFITEHGGHMNDIVRMKEITKRIREADSAYFGQDNPSITDREYDELVRELSELEKKTGIVFAGSPTQKVAGEVKNGLKPVTHTRPMLSVAKTKSITEVQNFASGRDVVVSWKLDGLTLVLRYENGNLEKAITRGSDGLVGEDVTHTVRLFRNVPQKISCKDSIEVRGEGVISWTDMSVLGKSSDEPTHPRNVVSGAVRSLTADRGKCSHLDFIAFELVGSGRDFRTKTEQLNYLSDLGFSTVMHDLVPGAADVADVIDGYDPEVFPYPVDGVVIEYDDIMYGKSLGATAHHENRMIALKWKDETHRTVFRGVELGTTRTGVVSLTAYFDPVNIDGTMVKRANLFNLGYFEKLKLGEGDVISVYKANMIIPQIAENHTQSGTYEIPMVCPSCGGRLISRYTRSGVKELYCPNEDCIARNAQKIARFCDKNAMNIEGLSAVTIEKFMENGWVKNFADLYHLDRYKDEIENSPGFSGISYEKYKKSIDRSRNCTMENFLMAMSIPLMGPQAARTIRKYYCGSWDEFEHALQDGFDFSHISGISRMLSDNILKWYKTEQRLWKPVLDEVNIRAEAAGDSGKSGGKAFTGLMNSTVVITGTINGMTRKQLTEVLSLMGATVSESVSKNTDLLIVGANPGGKKLGAAMQCGTKIITESQFIEMLGQ